VGNMTDDVQLKILIAIITICFTAIFGLMGYLAKRLIDDIKNNLENLRNEMKDSNRIQNDHAVKIAEHHIHIENIRNFLKLK
jgi:hypothetical protein